MNPATRAQREKTTVAAMIKLYCQANHKPANDLCPECLELLAYSQKRAENCKFGEDKPVCGNCTIHCYKKDMKAKVKDVMRFSGPRLIIYSPIQFIKHIFE